MKETNMSRVSALIAALPIAGLVFLGGAGTALAATPTAATASPAMTSAVTTGTAGLLADCGITCGAGGSDTSGENHPDNGPRHAGHRG
jgi:hypothetical protein